MHRGMEHSFTLTRGLRVSVFSQTALKYLPNSPVSLFCSLVPNQGSNPALVLISQQIYVEMPMISSVLRAGWGQILEGTQADTEEGVGGWLAPPSWSGGLCAEERERKRKKRKRRVFPHPPRQTLAISQDHWNWKRQRIFNELCTLCKFKLC